MTSLFRIDSPSGSRRVVVTSEVDASSADQTTKTAGLAVGLIEVKTTRRGRIECDLGPRTMLQIALNGAVQVACARVDRAGDMVVCPYVRARVCLCVCVPAYARACASMCVRVRGRARACLVDSHAFYR